SSISLLIRTPASTLGSYSKASVGVRFILSSLARRAWRTPCAAASPSSVLCCARSEPSTLTKTRACRRSAVVSTPVTVTKPMRGSFSSGTASDSTCRTARFTLRMRPLMEPSVPPADARLSPRARRSCGRRGRPPSPGRAASGRRRRAAGGPPPARGRRRTPAAASAARGRGGRPRRPRRRTAAAAGPSPTARTSACPSATPPPGSAARPRGCRRSRRPERLPRRRECPARSRREPPALGGELAQPLRGLRARLARLEAPLPVAAAEGPGPVHPGLAAEPEHVLHRQDRDARAGGEGEPDETEDEVVVLEPGRRQVGAHQRQVALRGAPEPLGERRVVVRARVDDGVRRVRGDGVAAAVPADEAAADDAHPVQPELAAQVVDGGRDQPEVLGDQ